MNFKAKWIRGDGLGNEKPIMFSKDFETVKEIKAAKLYISALGVYEACINGERVGDFVLAPGWTEYRFRVQYQEYDVTAMLKRNNKIEVTVASGWYNGRIARVNIETGNYHLGLIAQLEIEYADGDTETLITDEGWLVSDSKVRFSDIYDGEIYDAEFEPLEYKNATAFDCSDKKLIETVGEKICECEVFEPREIFTTPSGETVIDFGQNVTGYVETVLDANKGDVLALSFAEVLDKNGNFYTANYRAAKCIYEYHCKDGKQSYKPHTTFYGFRYVRVDKFPGGKDKVTPSTFKAICVHSDLKRTGKISTSNEKLNKFISNVFWGQLDNFLDVPTDCPQRDERNGWTGDAQVFMKTACLNYKVDKFYEKWIGDLMLNQGDNGGIPHTVPRAICDNHSSSGWGDAATICPWEYYLAYGNKELLKKHFPMMKKWLEYVKQSSTSEYLWTDWVHFGDWLGLDAEPGSYTGSSRKDFIASAYYAYSTMLTIRAGKIIGEDVSELEKLYEKIVIAHRKEYPEYLTQTECVLAIVFDIAEDKISTGNKLASMINSCGGHLETGFLGTPYLLHALSGTGHTELAYKLLLREESPSWLYQVSKGATTVWEHWDGINENGDFWSSDMNSYNHYAYGAVLDWIYTYAAGIRPTSEAPGYEKVEIMPHPNKALKWLDVSFESNFGTISSSWKEIDSGFRIEIETPVDARIVIDGVEHNVKPGKYYYYQKG